MRTSIMEVKTEITELKSSHEQTRVLISTNVMELCSRIEDIKTLTSEITNEQRQIKGQLSQLEDKIIHGEDKLKCLESDLNNIKASPLLLEHNQLSLNEQIIRECQERKKREKNVIFVGITEHVSLSTQERIQSDERAVLSITSEINRDIPKPIMIFRIGKYNPNKTRSIKVCYDNSETALLLLRNRGKLSENIKIFSDQTLAQRKYYLNTKEELRRRMNNGETDLTIKYINGIPNIIKLDPKNFNHPKEQQMAIK